MPQSLGKQMYYAVFMIEGQPDRAECSRLLDLLIKWAGMHKLHDYRAAIWEYPTPEGLGGQGMTAIKPLTMVQPFAEAQPLEESYAYIFLPGGLVAGDTYIEHNHFFLEVASCKKFKPSRILRELSLRKHNVLAYDRLGPVRAGTWRLPVDFE